MNSPEIIHLKHLSGLSISLTPFGATWLSCQIPVANPNNPSSGCRAAREILLSCRPADLAKQQAYLGATVGRYANRIEGAEWLKEGKGYPLSANQEGKHTLHGGQDNFSYRFWNVEKCNQHQVVFSLVSAEGDQGFLGNLSARVSYTLTDKSVIIDYWAHCDRESLCNLTNHAYFNLNGDGSALDARQQYLTIASDYYQPVDAQGIPNADLVFVENTPFDFRQAKLIDNDFSTVLATEPTAGYDHSWYFGNNETLKCAAELTDFNRQISLKLSMTQPALQVYTGNFLNHIPNRERKSYQNYAGVALESGCLPNSPNRADYLSDCLISPGKDYQHRSVYQFDW